MAAQIAHKIEARKRTRDIDISEDLRFAELLLSESVLKGLTKAGFHRPSPIQLKAIPLGRCGLDLIVQAKSGTGKTCVFTVIALEGLEIESSAIQVLVLAPTREIASQIWEVVRSIGSAIPGLRCHTFIGGMPVVEDKQKLSKCHIAIGTPGRIKQLIGEGMLKTDSIRLFVLDEADKLLEDGFQEQINWIYSSLPECKQMLALSATYPEYLAQHLTVYMKNPTFVRLNSHDPALLGIKQYYKIVPYSPLTPLAFQTKALTLIHLLSSASFQQCLVFSNHQSGAQSLCDLLNSRGWPSTCIAGKQEQSKRMQAMTKLRSYQCRVLVSTDLTSRGIDAENVNMVVNLDVPWDHETYLHRIGRAGRYGSFGAAVTIAMSGQEEANLHTIQMKCNTVIHPLPDPVPGNLVEAPVPQLSPSMEELVTTKEITTTKSHLSGADLKANTSPTSEHATRLMYAHQSDGDGRQICSKYNITEMNDYCKLSGKISATLENNLKSVTHNSVSHIGVNGTSHGDGDRLVVSGCMNGNPIQEPIDGTNEGTMSDGTSRCAMENSVCRTFSSSTVTLEPALDADQILDDGTHEKNAETSSSDNSVSQLTTPTLTLSDILNDNYVHGDGDDSSIQQNNNGLEAGLVTNQSVDLINGDCELYTPSIPIGALSCEPVVNGVHNDTELANAISEADKLVNDMSTSDYCHKTLNPEQAIDNLLGDNPMVEKKSIDTHEASGIELLSTKGSSVPMRVSDHATPSKELSAWETHAELLSLTPEKCIVTDLPDTLLSDFTASEPCDVAINNLLGKVNWKMRSPESRAYQAMVNELKDAESVRSGNNTPALSPCSTDGTLYAVSSISTQQDNSYGHTDAFLSSIDNHDNIAQYTSFSNNATGYEFNSDGMVCENDGVESMLVYCGGISDGTIQHVIAEQQDAVEVPQVTVPMQKTDGSVVDDYLTAEEDEADSQARIEQVNYVSQYQDTNMHSEFAETRDDAGCLDATGDLQDTPQTVVVNDVTGSVMSSIPVKPLVELDHSDAGLPDDFTIPPLKSRGNHRKWHKYSSALRDMESSEFSQENASSAYIESTLFSSRKLPQQLEAAEPTNKCEFIIPPFQNGFTGNGSSRVWHTYASAVEELEKFAADYSNARDYNMIDWEAVLQTKKTTPIISTTLLDSLSHYLSTELTMKFADKEINETLETLDNHSSPIETLFVDHFSADILDSHMSPTDQSSDHMLVNHTVGASNLNQDLSCVSITYGVPTAKTTDHTTPDIMSKEASCLDSEVSEKLVLDNCQRSNCSDSLSPKAACMSVANECLIAKESDVLKNPVSANVLPTTEPRKPISEDIDSLASSISTADTEYLELDDIRCHAAHASISSESAVINDEVALLMDNDSSVTSYYTNSIQSNEDLSATDTNVHLLSDANVVKEVLEDCVSRVVVATEIDEVISECRLKSSSTEDVSLLDIVSQQMLNSAFTHNAGTDSTGNMLVNNAREETSQIFPPSSSSEHVFINESDKDAMLRNNANKSISVPDIASGICHLSRTNPASKSETRLSEAHEMPEQSTSFQRLVIHDIVNDIMETTITNMSSLVRDSVEKVTTKTSAEIDTMPEYLSVRASEPAALENNIVEVQSPLDTARNKGQSSQNETVHEIVSAAVVTTDIIGMLGFVTNLVEDSISEALVTYCITQQESEKDSRLDEDDAHKYLCISEDSDRCMAVTESKLNLDAIPLIATQTSSFTDSTNKYSTSDILVLHKMTVPVTGENMTAISESASNDSLLDALSDQAIFDTIEGSTVTSGLSSIKDIKIENQLNVEMLSEPDKECGDKVAVCSMEDKSMPSTNNQILLDDSCNASRVVTSQARESKSTGRFRRYAPMSVSSLLYTESAIPAAWNKSLKGSVSQVTLPVLEQKCAPSFKETIHSNSNKKTPAYDSPEVVVTTESSHTSSAEKVFVEQTSLRKVKSVASRPNRGGRKRLCNKANKSENTFIPAVSQKNAMISQKKVSRLQQAKDTKLKDISKNVPADERILVHCGNISESSTDSYVNSNDTSDTDSSFWDTFLSTSKTGHHAHADFSFDRKLSKGQKTSDTKGSTKLKSTVKGKSFDKWTGQSYLSPQSTEHGKQRSRSAEQKYGNPVEDVNHVRDSEHIRATDHLKTTEHRAIEHVRAKKREMYSDYLYSNYKHPSSLLALDDMIQHERQASSGGNMRSECGIRGGSLKQKTHNKDVKTPERIGSDKINRKYKHKSKLKHKNMTVPDAHLTDENTNPYLQHPYGYYGAYPPVHPAIYPYWLHPGYGVPMYVPHEEKQSRESPTPRIPPSSQESPIPRMPLSSWSPSHYYTSPQNMPHWQDPANNPSTMWNMPPYHQSATMREHFGQESPSLHLSPDPQSPAYLNSSASSSKPHSHSTKKSTHGNVHGYSGPSASDSELWNSRSSNAVPPHCMAPALWPPWLYNPYYSHWYPGSDNYLQPPRPAPSVLPPPSPPPPPYWTHSMYASYHPPTSTQSSPGQHHQQSVSPAQHPSYWNYSLPPWQYPWQQQSHDRYTSSLHEMQQGVEDKREKQEHLGKMMNLQQEYIRKMMKMYKLYQRMQ